MCGRGLGVGMKTGLLSMCIPDNLPLNFQLHHKINQSRFVPPKKKRGKRERESEREKEKEKQT